ncbi:MAG: Protein of unknown function (DUF1553)/Protein of unknown function (DUF1549)/Planctomycete [Pedosphaera sp.]|nr:Protein of unknown function (DUF1553)/Protein of unknown function (DUF1549)/Planctomycete [Pedosphaera sp.]
MAGLAILMPMLAKAATVANDPAGIEFFEKTIRPILADNCYSCHSQQSKKIKGNFLLDTREGLLKGGDTGPAIEPHDPDKSLLIKAVRYTDDNLQMPPKNKKLSAEKIASLEAWVKMGAPDPRVGKISMPVETIREKAGKHWAFQPVSRPALPTIKNRRWTETPVDNFILSRLEGKGITPSPRADKRTLIRRASFDLTGLPPKPEEVEAFIADTSPDAFAKVVDRLLASPRYGERWGRHWLDVARYADTKGYVFEEERRYPFSYTYRDYVIRAFNEDLPYDQFIQQQIAADLMPLGNDKRPLAALGYLTLGRRFVNNIHDIIDDRIDVVTRGMMGLTVSCARCHDHKFDPIPTKDYYSLYGVFASSQEPQEEPLLGTHPDSKVYEEYLAEHAKREKERQDFIANKEKEVATQIRRRSGDYLLAAYEKQHSPDKEQAADAAAKKKLDAGLLNRWVTSLDTWSKTTNSIFAPWFAFAALQTNDFPAKAKGLAAKFSTNKGALINSLVAKAFAGASPTNMADVAERYGKLLVEADQHWEKALVTTNTAPTALADAAEEALRQVLFAADAPANLPHNEFDRFYDIPSSQMMRALKRKVDELDATHAGAPPRAMALEDKATPYNVQVFIRGNTGNRGPEVPRQFLEVVAGKDRKPFTKGSGRLELAQAITDRNNPLTARVFVNRVWLHHFGVPLVGTTSDFGLRSDPPTNPELLDYLAARFMEDGWSIKKLHRLIMLSSTYQQSSQENPAYARIDPGNQLLWRMNRQRLEFESVRDTLLMVSGKLDCNQGGHSVDIIGQPFSTRRTVYGYIDRQNLPNLFRTFDFASPDTTNPRRFFTTVPQQALFLMNSPFVVEQAKNLVDRPEFKAAPTEEQKLRLMYQLALQRDPTREEIKLAEEFTKAQPPGVQAPPATTNWLFGFGTFDAATKQVQHFRPLPYFDGHSFQGGPTLPDKKLGWVLVSGTGGHPGDQKHSAIRRWIAPRDGKINITGELAHALEKGDGVRGRIVSSRKGELGEWLVHKSKEETHLEKVEVKQGESIDFVTDCRDNVENDSFAWSPTIRFVADGNTTPSQKMEWNALKDFAEATQPSHENLSAWQKYAQVLLLTNELVFVD